MIFHCRFIAQCNYINDKYDCMTGESRLIVLVYSDI